MALIGRRVLNRVTRVNRIILGMKITETEFCICVC